jgi:hypothetical protein
MESREAGAANADGRAAVVIGDQSYSGGQVGFAAQ